MSIHGRGGHAGSYLGQGKTTYAPSAKESPAQTSGQGVLDRKRNDNMSWTRSGKGNHQAIKNGRNNPRQKKAQESMSVVDDTKVRRRGVHKETSQNEKGFQGTRLQDTLISAEPSSGGLDSCLLKGQSKEDRCLCKNFRREQRKRTETESPELRYPMET